MNVWPLRPNWRGSYRVTYEFLTEIITSRSGKEQRRAKRQTPRKTVEFLSTVADDRWRVLVQTFHALQGAPMLLAEIPQGVRLTADMGAGASAAQVAEIRDWISPGRKVMLVDGDRIRERTVDIVAGNTVTFDEATVNGWPAGARLCPALEGRLPPSVTVQQFLPRAGETTIPFSVDPGTELPRDPGLPVTVWNGREVFDVFKPNWASPRDLSFAREAQTLDYGRGRTRTFLPVAFGITTRSADYIATSVTEANALLAFFERHKGRRGEFYVPTDNADVILAAPSSSGFLFVEGTDFAAAYDADPVAQALSFRMADGSRFYRKVVGVTPQAGQSRIQLDVAVPYQIGPQNVEVISWLPVLRNATDELTIEWLTDSAARVRFNFMSLPAATAELP